MAKSVEIKSGNDGKAAIGLILMAMFFISINDMMIKALSDGYPLHQMVFIRSAIGICIALMILRMEGGFHLLKTTQPGLHLVRALLIVFANMTFFAALAVMPLATATAIFFVAPLFITLLSIPILGEKVGPRRLGAVIVGFLGVVVMTQPWSDADAGAAGGWTLALPILAALGYAGMNVLTRKLGVKSSAAAMAIYIQGAFLCVGGIFFLVAGDGRFAERVEHDSLIFLLRAWTWPATEDVWMFVLIGVLGGGIGYAISQAYRTGAPATVAPFEYAALPMAIFWGWVVFGEVPSAAVWVGIVLIASAGLYVFWRERQVSET